MSAPIRTLIVDDSAVVRTIVRSELDADSRFVVHDVARTGADALEKIEQDAAGKQEIQAVVLDDVMPEMTGKEMLKQIKGRFTHLTVVLFSANVGDGAEGTMDALFHGADDAVRKPSSSREGLQATMSELLTKLVKACTRNGQVSTARAPVPMPRRDQPRGTEDIVRPTIRLRSPRPIITAIGASTGGPQALMEVLRRMPARVPTPILIAQHVPADFSKRLAKRLNDACEIHVCEAEEGMRPRPGTAYVAPGDWHMRLVRDGASLSLTLDQGERVHSTRPAVDVLFDSIVDAVGGAAVACILTGMGSDGLAGVQRLREKGAGIVVQNEASSIVWGMPGFVARAGAADAILPIEMITEELLAWIDPTLQQAVQANNASETVGI